ncbi:hypothetical protein K3495_g7476 [Podosphaera aphanis]|nr:hypothetical protein K3495_g7476 [Podosphaera aphanis]
MHRQGPQARVWHQGYNPHTLVFDIDSSPLHPPDDELPESSTYFSSVTSVINPRALTQFLVNQAFEHAITRTDPTDSNDPQSISNYVAFLPSVENTQSIDTFSFLRSARYANDIFYGIVIDTGASRNSTAGYSQYQALCKVVDTPINTSTAGTVKVQFGIGCTTSIGSIILTTTIGDIEFHIVKADTQL